MFLDIQKMQTTTALYTTFSFISITSQLSLLLPAVLLRNTETNESNSCSHLAVLTKLLYTETPTTCVWDP